MGSPSIVQYREYRDFVCASLEQWKSRGPKYSFQAAARKLGTSRAYLKLLVDKRRHMSLDKAAALSKLFRWNAFERQYFLFLYLRGTTRSQALAEFFDSILASLRYYERNKFPIGEIQDKDRSDAFIFRDWLLMVLPQAALLRGFRNDPAWIQALLGGPGIVDLTSVKSAIARLIEKGILVTDGNLLARKRYSDRVSPYDPEEFQRFKTGLARSALALDRKGQSDVHRPNRFQMYALALNEASEKRILALYDQLDHEFRTLFRGVPNADRILFVSNNLFAVSKISTEVEGLPRARSQAASANHQV